MPAPQEGILAALGDSFDTAVSTLQRLHFRKSSSPHPETSVAPMVTDLSRKRFLSLAPHLAEDDLNGDQLEFLQRRFSCLTPDMDDVDGDNEVFSLPDQPSKAPQEHLLVPSKSSPRLRPSSSFPSPNLNTEAAPEQLLVPTRNEPIISSPRLRTSSSFRSPNLNIKAAPEQLLVPTRNDPIISSPRLRTSSSFPSPNLNISPDQMKVQGQQ